MTKLCWNHNVKLHLNMSLLLKISSKSDKNSPCNNVLKKCLLYMKYTVKHYSDDYFLHVSVYTVKHYSDDYFLHVSVYIQ
jgi:hypothetical protein